MTFDKANWGETDVGFAYTVARNFKYQTTVDTLATVIASGYFNDVVADLKQYSFIEIVASDDIGWYYVNSATGVSPVTVLSIIDSSIIPDNAVTLPKLAPGVTPSHVARFGGKFGYGGGGTSIAEPVVGVVATDIVLCTMQAQTGTAYIVKAVPTTDTVTITFSADPGASTVVAYTIFNAAS